MTRIQIGGTWYTVDWSRGLEDICEDCYDWDRKDHIGNLRNLRIYELYAHGECYLVERYFDDGSYTEGIAGTPRKCDYEEVGE